MQCLYCGKGIGPFRQLRDVEFCSDVHRSQYAERYRQRLYAALAPEPAPSKVAGFIERAKAAKGPAPQYSLHVLPKSAPDVIVPPLGVNASGVFLARAEWVGETLASMPARAWLSEANAPFALWVPSAAFSLAVQPPSRSPAGMVYPHLAPHDLVTRLAAAAPRAFEWNRQLPCHAPMPGAILEFSPHQAELSAPQLASAGPALSGPSLLGSVMPALRALQVLPWSAAIAAPAALDRANAAEEAIVSPVAIASHPRPLEARPLPVAFEISTARANGIILARPPAATARTILIPVGPSPASLQVSAAVASAGRPPLESRHGLGALAPWSRPADSLPVMVQAATPVYHAPRTPGTVTPVILQLTPAALHTERTAARVGALAEVLGPRSASLREVDGQRAPRSTAVPVAARGASLKAEHSFTALPGVLESAPCAIEAPAQAAPSEGVPAWEACRDASAGRLLAPASLSKVAHEWRALPGSLASAPSRTGAPGPQASPAVAPSWKTRRDASIGRLPVSVVAVEPAHQWTALAVPAPTACEAEAPTPALPAANVQTVDASTGLLAAPVTIAALQHQWTVPAGDLAPAQCGAEAPTPALPAAKVSTVDTSTGLLAAPVTIAALQHQWTVPAGDLAPAQCGAEAPTPALPAAKVSTVDTSTGLLAAPVTIAALQHQWTVPAGDLAPAQCGAEAPTPVLPAAKVSTVDASTGRLAAAVTIAAHQHQWTVPAGDLAPAQCGAGAPTPVLPAAKVSTVDASTGRLAVPVTVAALQHQWTVPAGDLVPAQCEAEAPDSVPSAARVPTWDARRNAAAEHLLAPGVNLPPSPISSVPEVAGMVAGPVGATHPGKGRDVRACAVLWTLRVTRVCSPVFETELASVDLNELARGARVIPFVPDSEDANPPKSNVRPFKRTTPELSRKQKWQYIGAAAAALLLAGALRPQMLSRTFGKPPSWNGVSIRDWMSSRATRNFEDDFRSGLNQWKSVQAQWPKNWSHSTDGFIHPGQLALYRPSVPLSDYRFEFMAQIENKSVDWVVRAQDAGNYYAVKFTVVRPGPRPEVAMVRYPVIGGNRGVRVQTPVRLMVHANRPYRVTVDVKGNRYRTFIEGEEADFWVEDRLKTGGVGFFSEAGERARVYWVKLESHGDLLGRICGLLSGKSAEATNQAMNHLPGGPGSYPDSALSGTEVAAISEQQTRLSRVLFERHPALFFPFGQL